MLACCLIDGGTSIGAALDARISDDSFYDLPNRVIWACLCDMRRSGLPIDEAILVEELKKRGKLEVAGGFVRINTITDQIPTTAHFTYYVEQLRNQALLRKLIAVANSAIAAAYDNQGNAEKLVGEVERDLLGVTQQFSTVLPPLHDIATLLAHPPALPAEVIRGVLHRGSKLIIGAPSKGRKTWSLLDLGVAVATGTPWWGMQTVKGRVCYINFEIPEPFFVQRSKSVAHHKKTELVPGLMDIWTLRGHARSIEELRPLLLAQLLTRNYALIIFDPVYKMLGDRDENSAGDVAQMLNELERIAVRTNAAIAFAAHYAKGNASGKDPIDRIGGSGVFARDADAIFTMTQHEEDDHMTIDVTLRNNSPVAPFVIEWSAPVFNRSEKNPEDLRQPKSAKKETTEGHSARRLNFDPKEIVAYFPRDVANAQGLGEIARAATEGCGISKVQFASMRLELLERAWIAQDMQSRWFRTTTAEQFL